MSRVVSADDVENFKIIGLALPQDAKQCIAAAFADSAQYAATIEQLEQMTALRSGRDQVVIFCYMPAVLSSTTLEAWTLLKNFSAKVIGLHSTCDQTVLDNAFEAGFDGVLECDVAPETYRRVSSKVLCGELWFPRAYLSHRTRALRTTVPSGLSVRETEIFHLVAAGRTNQFIADALYISRDTVRWHLRSIYTKLGASDREALLAR